MAYQSYITFDEYEQLGGIASEEVFNVFERKAQRFIDHITYDRVKLLDEVPEVVKEVLTEYINKMGSHAVSSSTNNSIVGDIDNIVQYSNGVETITWRKNTEEETRKELTTYASTMLPDWLVCRVVSFDAEDYVNRVPIEYLDPDADSD